MPEQLKLYLPCYLQDDLIPHMRETNPGFKHEIMHLPVPYLPHRRAAYYHSLLERLWQYGYGDIRPKDIFALHRDQQQALDRYHAIIDSKPIQPNHATGGNVHAPIAATNPAAAQALDHLAVYDQIRAYLALPREQALLRTRDHQYTWENTPRQTSEAEHWLRHPYVHAEFSDTIDIQIELHREKIKNRRHKNDDT